MSRVLERIWESRKEELQSADIKIEPNQNLIITREKAMRFKTSVSQRKIELILRPLIREAKKRKKAATDRLQVTLF